MGSNTQTSASTQNTLSFPQTYTVTAQSGAAKNYTVSRVISKPHLYATSFGNSGIAMAWEIDESNGDLINPTFYTLHGGWPVNIVVTPNGQYIYVSNGSANSDSKFFADPISGALSSVNNQIITLDQRVITIDSTGSFLYARTTGNGADPGGVAAYTIDKTNGNLTQIGVGLFTAGIWSVGFAITPNSQYAYITNAFSSFISAFSVNSDGSLTPFSSDPNGPAVGSAGDIQITPDGKYAYVLSGGGQYISTFSIDQNGVLSTVGSDLHLGGNLLNITIKDSFLYILDAGNNEVLMFSIDTLGGLSAIGAGSVSTGNGPVTFEIEPSGTYAYVTNTGDQTLSSYKINNDGSLTALSSFPASYSVLGPMGIN